MVGEQLERHDREDRHEALLGVRYLEAVVGDVAHIGIALGDDADNLALASLDLLYVAEYLVIASALRSYDDHRHLLVDEGDRAVLHLRCRVALGVDVGDFLELEGALEGHRVVVAASEVEEVADIGEYLREVGDLLVVLEYLCNLVRYGLQLVDELYPPLVGNGAELLGEAESEEEEGRDLCGKCLGGGHADFRADVRVAAGIGGAGDGRAYHIADAEEEGPGLAGKLDGRQGICGLAGLRDGDYHIVRVYDRLAVPELGSVLDLNRDAGEFLDYVFAYQAGVPGSTAGADDKPLGSQQLVSMVDDAGELDGAELRVESALHGGAQGARLLEDFLEHEVRESALLDLAEAHLQLAYHRGLLDLAEVGDFQIFAALDVGYLLLAEIDDLVGVFDDRRCVGANEVFILPHSDDERAALAGGYHPVRLRLVDDDERVGSHHIAQGEWHCLLEADAVRIHNVLDELHYDLRIRLTHKVVAQAGKLGLEGEVVLDDSVVDEGQAMVLGEVRVGVAVARLAVGRPAGVGYAHGAADILVGRHRLEVLDLAFGLVNHEVGVVVDEGHAGAVVASVLEPCKALDQYRVGLPAAYISYYSTHNCYRLKLRRPDLTPGRGRF